MRREREAGSMKKQILRPLLRLLAQALLVATPLCVAHGAMGPSDQPTVWAGKPDVAAFEKIENARLDAAQKAIDQLVGAKGARTVANTLEPYDEAVRQINSAIYFSTMVQQVHPDATYRDRATKMTTQASSVQTALSLNRAVFDALSKVEPPKDDPATAYYLKRTLLEFHLAGVDKDDATRERLHKLNDRLTEDQSNFERNIADDVPEVVIDDVKLLDGLPQDYIDRHKPGADGKIHLTTNYPDLFPALHFAKSDELRQRMWSAWNSRAYPKNRAVLLDMAQARGEIAGIIGYSSWADFNAADKMIRSGANIGTFLAQLDAAARPIAEREFAMLLAEKRKTQPDAVEIHDYEGAYLPELVKRAQYDFDSQSVRPYFPYERVRQGILDTAATLFHLRFQREDGAPSWDPTVETFDVFEADRMIGRFYLDMHPRPGKYSHAQMAPVLDGVRGKQLPEAILECNFSQPTATDPGLLTYEDVVTFFHEFGHLMHHILGGHQRWAGISGITMEADFVEAPSQMLEEWMHSPQVLASFGRHYKTGETIPADLVARMNRASAFGRAVSVLGQIALSAVSYDLYRIPASDVDPEVICLRDFRHYALAVPSPSEAHMFGAFGHLAGYSSAYYTYQWDKVISEDFFQRFDHDNLLAGPVPMRYRRTVLEPGGSMSANDLVHNFLGRAQDTTAYQKWLGEEFAGSKPVAEK
jgi:thimet oligopeptidase